MSAARRVGLASTLRWIMAALVVVVLIDALAGDRGLIALLESRRQDRILLQQLDAQRRENAALREEARRLREDPSAIEQVARRDLGLIMPGEVMIVVRDVERPRPLR